MVLLNKRGNVVAVFVIVAVMLLFVLMLLTQKNPELAFEKVTSKKIKTETIAVMERALESTIDRFAGAGFDYAQAKWYFDRPIPPRVDWSAFWLKSYFLSDLNLLLERLKDERKYVISGPIEVRFDINAVSVDDWTSDYSRATNADANEFQVGVDINYVTSGITGEKTKIINIRHTRLLKKLRLWFAYNKIVEWMETDAGGISERTAELIGECWVRQCDPLAPLSRTSLGLGVPGWGASESAARAIAEDSVASLNQHLQGTDIQCEIVDSSWTYKEVPPQETFSVTVRNDYCSCPAPLYEGMVLSWQCQEGESPDDGCLFGFPPIREKVSRLWPPFSDFEARGSGRYEYTGPGPSEPHLPPTGYGGTEIFEGIALHESLGSKAMFSAKYAVRCTEPRSKVARAQEFGPMIINLGFEFSAKRDCDPKPVCEGGELTLQECEEPATSGGLEGTVCHNYPDCEDSSGVPYTCGGRVVVGQHLGQRVAWQRVACCIG